MGTEGKRAVLGTQAGHCVNVPCSHAALSDSHSIEADSSQSEEFGGEAPESSKFSLGKRGVLARHIPCHWNRMGFTARQQAIWSRAAREAVIGIG